MSVVNYEIDDVRPTVLADNPPFFILALHSAENPLRLRIKRRALRYLKDEIELRLQEFPEGGDDP
jgi:hypothetical protein